MLVADIGNSDIVFGFFKNDSLTHTLRVPSSKQEDALFFDLKLRNFILENGIDSSILTSPTLSSVVPELTPIIADVMERVCHTATYMIKPNCHAAVSVNIENVNELGADLYTNAVSAFSQSKSGCVVVDFGTALTFTTVSDEGKIEGVIITPGLKTAVKSLFTATAQLPEVPLEKPKSVLGKNTIDAIQSGIMYGYEGMVKEILRRIKGEFDTPLKVYATGGLSSILTGIQDEFDKIDIHLTLNGLYIIGTHHK